MKAKVKIVLASRRRCFYRDEKISLSLSLMNFFPHNLSQSRLQLQLASLPPQSQDFATLGTFKQNCDFEFAPHSLRSGSYNLQATFYCQDKIIAQESFSIAVALRRRPGVCFWHWPATVHYNALEADEDSALQQLDLLASLGYKLAQFRGNWAVEQPAKAQWLIEEAMQRGIELGILIENSAGGVFAMHKELPEEARLIDSEGKATDLADSFHPSVQDYNCTLMERLMLLFKEFPACSTVFMNSEVEDRLKLAHNPETLAMHEKKLGFKLEQVSRQDCLFTWTSDQADYLQDGVIDADDKNYLYAKYYFRDGDGYTNMNRLMAAATKKHRPDITLISDPLRYCSIFGRFSGIDVISSWTYTNPDPKATLYIETLRCAAKPEQKSLLHTITLWNYAGSLVPSGENRFAREQTLRMGPDRFKECAWINFVRAPMAIGTYFGSPIEPCFEGGDPFIYSPETEDAIREFNREILLPFGEFISRTRQKQRRIAVLDAFASRVYGVSPRPYNHYPNYAVYGFYILLSMAGLEADIVFEESLLSEGLEQYEMLVLPACDTLTKPVYDKICEFAKDGGLLLGDQYLRAELPGLIRLDFDFSYRKRVSANANAKNTDYSIQDDSNFRRSWEAETSRGVPADLDQERMEAYCEKLQAALANKFTAQYRSSSPRILLNCREYDGVDYLSAVNDHRGWGERCGKWKAMLEKGLPESALFTLEGQSREPFVYEMISQTRVELQNSGPGQYQFHFTLPPAGGALFAIYPEEPGEIRVQGSAPGRLSIHTGFKCGLQPLKLEIPQCPDASGYYVAEKGLLELDLPAAQNEIAENWQLEVIDLSCGGKSSR